MAALPVALTTVVPSRKIAPYTRPLSLPERASARMASAAATVSVSGVRSGDVSGPVSVVLALAR